MSRYLSVQNELDECAIQIRMLFAYRYVCASLLSHVFLFCSTHSPVWQSNTCTYRSTEL